MADREKVIKAIEVCYILGHNCTECPLFFEDDCSDKLMHDALALLKTQEAVEPIFKQDEDGIVWACGSCGAYMYHNGGIKKAKEYAKYCRQCGKAVKWDA